MSASKITFADKAPLQNLYASEVNLVKSAINANADLLDAAVLALAQKIDGPGLVAVLAAAGKSLNELALPQQVKAGTWYVTTAGIWEARRNFGAATEPTAGPNWRMVALFGVPGPASTDELTEGSTNLYFTAARAIGAALAGYTKPATPRAIAPADSIRTAIGLLEKKADSNAAALGTAPAYVSITAAGVRNSLSGTLQQALNQAGEGGSVIVNRQTEGVGTSIGLGRNITLDLQGHSLDLMGADFQMYSGSRIVNCGLIHNGRIFVRDGNAVGIQSIQGGKIAAQLYSQANTNPIFRLYGTQVVNFGAGQATPATLSPTQDASVGNLTIELHDGAAFVAYPPAPQTTLITVATGSGIDRRELFTISGYRTNTLVLEGSHQLSQPSAGPNVQSLSAQVITTTGGTPTAYSAPRTGTVAQVIAALNADLTAVAAAPGVLVYVRVITVPVTATDETHFLLTVSA